MNVCIIGTRQFVQAWNCRYIPSKGIPNELQRSSRTVKLPEGIISECEVAVSEFASSGGHLTTSSEFGIDPLAHRTDLLDERYQQFHQQFPNYSPVFHAITNGICGPLIDCIKLYICLTECLSALL